MNPFSLDHILSRSLLHFFAPVSALSGSRRYGHAARPMTFRCQWTVIPRAPPRFPFPRVVKEQRLFFPGAAWAPEVGLVRVELTTSRLSGVRSNHLSYRPIAEWFPRPAFPALPGNWPLQDPARARRVRCIQ
jgi:hypothetical protein